MVGTRKASAYGMLQSKRLGYELARCGVIVVSGGAGGIDTTGLGDPNNPTSIAYFNQTVGDRVLFAVDYPFEEEVSTVQQAAAIPMEQAAAEAFFHGNAERLFRIDPA